MLIIYFFFAFYILNPHRAFRKFLNAIEYQDLDAIYEFILDEEKQYGLSKEDVQRLMNWMFYRHAPKVKALHFSPSLADRWLRVPVKWLNGETNQPLTINGRRMVGYVNLFRRPGRWKWQISFTHFVKDYLYLNIAPVKLRRQGWTGEKIGLNPSQYKSLREEVVTRMLRQLGIKEVFPLPAKILKRGKYIVIWEK